MILDQNSEMQTQNFKLNTSAPHALAPLNPFGCAKRNLTGRAVHFPIW
jgi:hypothetical protein